MKIELINGWKQAPHCWRRYIFKPLSFERTPGWFVVTIFGFVFFFLPDITERMDA